MAILIVPTQAIADEIFATPQFDPSPDPVLLGTPLELADGRLAFVHPWPEIVVDWLSGYCQNINGAEVIEGDALPYEVKQSSVLSLSE